jgi:hypothetical protein
VLVYLDQNAVAAPSAEELQSRSEVQIVLSSVHWLEASRCSTDFAASIQAERLDTFNSTWLREPNAVGEREVRAALAGNPGAIDVIEPYSRSKTDVLNDIIPGGIGSSIIRSSWDIVQSLRNNPSAARTLTIAHSTNEYAFRENVRDIKRNELSKADRWKTLLRGFCKVFDLTSDNSAIDRMNMSAIPSLVVRFEANWIFWERARKDETMRMSTQKRNDLFHIAVALPYTDYVVTADIRLRKLIETIRPLLPFRTATVVNNLANIPL